MVSDGIIYLVVTLAIIFIITYLEIIRFEKENPKIKKSKMFVYFLLTFTPLAIILLGIDDYAKTAFETIQIFLIMEFFD